MLFKHIFRKLFIFSFLFLFSFAYSFETLGTGRIIVSDIESFSGIADEVYSVSWTSDGKHILLDKKSPVNYGLFSFDPVSREFKRLASSERSLGSGNTADCSSPNTNSDGRFTLFCGREENSRQFSHTGPGYGLHSDLWLKDNNNNSFHKLLTGGFSLSNPKGNIFPSFSPDGKKILWTTILGQSRTGSVMRKRAISIADLQVRRGRYELAEIKQFTPGVNLDFYEAYSFTPDGKKILFAGNLADKQGWYSMDLHLLDITTQEISTLTDIPGIWNRFAAMSPKGEKIVWSCSLGLTIPNLGPGGRFWEKYMSSELWIMNKDGSGKKRLTGFNQRTAPEFSGVRSLVGCTAWSPDGKKIALVLHREGVNFELTSTLLILNLADSATPAPVGQ